MRRNWKVAGNSVDRLVNLSVTLELEPTPQSANVTELGSWGSRCRGGMRSSTSIGRATPVRPTSWDSEISNIHYMHRLQERSDG